MVIQWWYSTKKGDHPHQRHGGNSGDLLDHQPWVSLKMENVDFIGKTWENSDQPADFGGWHGVPYFRLKPGCACWIFFHWNCPNILNQHMGNSDIYRWLSLKENLVNSTWLESGRSPMMSIDLFHSYHPCILYIYIHIIYIYVMYVCVYIYTGEYEYMSV